MINLVTGNNTVIKSLKSRRLRWEGHVARMEQSRSAYRVLVGKPEGKRPLGRPRRRREDNIKMDLREEGYDPGEWINLDGRPIYYDKPYYIPTCCIALFRIVNVCITF